MKLNESLIKGVNISGQGGSEKKLAPLMSSVGFVRTSMPLYDFINHETGEKIEIKKQSGAQWLDLSKYADMTDEDRKITMWFVMHNKGAIDGIYSIKLGAFIDMLCEDPRYFSSGFDWSTIRDLARLRKKHKSLQTKAGVNIRKLILKEYPNSFNRLY
tara:strand:+ start:426 stop:899 length:474 start_codon:yes stop_codon:yes gene_type:complete